MSLHAYNDVEQRSEQWFALRRGIVTASVVGQLITPSTRRPADNDKSRGIVGQLIAERITGWTEETYQSSDMLRGTMDESIARAVYAQHYAPVTECGFMVLDEDGYSIGYSPDGLVGTDGLVEIKSRTPKAQIAVIVADQVPVEHVAQVQCGLLVSGCAWCDYVSFAGGLPLYVKRVYPDATWFDAVRAAVQRFEEIAETQIGDYRAQSAGLHMTQRINYDLAGIEF